MVNNELVIISMTSWKKRINNVSRVVYSILKGSILPDKIICNLSIDEFPLKEKELPLDLLLFQKTTCFEINWVKENTKAFKKIIPTIQNYFDKPNTIVISIDDDMIYPKSFIKDYITALIDNNAYITTTHGNKSKFGNYITTGCACGYKVSFFNSFLWEGLNDEIIKTNEDDVWYTFCLKINNIKNVQILFKEITFNEIDPMGKLHLYDINTTYNTIFKYHEKIWKQHIK
jgi:hypothetical protein